MNIIINLLFIFILGIFVIVYNLNKLYYNYGNAINVPRELLYNVLKPGIYEGVSTTSGDVLSLMDGCLYKNGQKSIHRLYISKTLNGIKFENIIKVHDSVSGDFLHTLKRDGEFTYMHIHPPRPQAVPSSLLGWAICKTSPPRARPDHPSSQTRTLLAPPVHH